MSGSNQYRILVLCTGNSCRSQMAEGFFCSLAAEKVTVDSAGITTHGLNPLAVKAMAEIGIDISDQTSDNVSRYLNNRYDYVITVCDNAAESCPAFPGETNRIHWSFEDPAKAEGTESERLKTFAQIRDQIGEQIKKFLAGLD